MNSGERKHSLLMLVGLSLICVAAYAPAMTTYFVADDFFFVPNPEAQLRPIFNLEFRGDKPHRIYRPLFNASFGLDKSFWGDWPAGYRLVNLTLHIANSWLVYWLALIVFKNARQRRWLAALAGAFFAVYARHSEAVSWITGRSDVLCTFFFLISVVAACSLRSSRIWLGVALVSGFASLLSKEMAFTLPLVVFAVLAFISAGSIFQRLGRAFTTSLPFFGILIGCLLLRRVVLGTPLGGYVRHADSSPLSLVHSLAAYMAGIVVPGTVSFVDLAVFFQSQVFLFLVILGVVLVAGTWLLVKFSTPLLWLGILWVLVTLSPVANLRLNLVYTQGERFLYLPSVGVALSVAALVAFCIRKWGSQFAAVAAMLLLFVQFGALYAVNRNWGRAGLLSEQIIGSVADYIERERPEEPLLLLAAPDSYRGAYVLRNGLEAALKRLHGVPSPRIQVASYVQMDSAGQEQQIDWFFESQDLLIGEIASGRHLFKFPYSTPNKALFGGLAVTHPLDLNTVSLASRVQVKIRKPRFQALVLKDGQIQQLKPPSDSFR